MQSLPLVIIKKPRVNIVRGYCVRRLVDRRFSPLQWFSVFRATSRAVRCSLAGQSVCNPLANSRTCAHASRPVLRHDIAFGRGGRVWPKIWHTIIIDVRGAISARAAEEQRELRGWCSLMDWLVVDCGLLRSITGDAVTWSAKAGQ